MSRVPNDYHLHTAFSCDSQATMAAQCEAAIALGLREICVTDHSDWEPLDSCSGFYRPDAYFAELAANRERYGDRLTIRAGVEIGEIHRFGVEAAQLLSAHPYDFAIGSLHWVTSRLTLTPGYFEGWTPKAAYETYYAELLDVVDAGGFDVIGHIDVPKRAGFSIENGYDSNDYEEPLRAVLRAAIERGIGIEINTGTARRPVGKPSPDLPVLQWYRELGGEIVTVGSDAHRPEHIGYRFDDARELLDAAGFTAITRFEGRKATFIDL